MQNKIEVEALTPQQITEYTKNVGIAKANKPFIPQVLMGILAGAYIGFGAMFYTLIKSDKETLGFALTNVLCGVAFSVGLILVVIAGAELFTGNNLLTIAWAEKKIKTKALLRNWGIIIGANFIGAVLLALLIYATGHPEMNHHKIAETYVKVANAKCDLPFWTALCRGIVCNILVCLGVWLAYAGRTVADKVLGIIFPITAFVAAGFEHSVANMYVITMGLLCKGDVTFASDALNIIGFIGNVIPVLIGNIIGGGIFVGLTYWAICLRKAK